MPRPLSARRRRPASHPLVTEGDPDRGIAPCSGCHQPNGGGSEAGAAARLAGIGEQYIVNQIENFRNGNRNHPVMTPWAKELTDAEVKALAAYYDALPPASNAVVPPNLKREDGQWLALYGDWPNRRLPACQQCHGPLGIGAGADFPALAGQPYSYLVNQMANWGTGAPVGDKDIPGRGYPKLEKTADGFDPERGAVVYAEHCAICHGENGEGGYAGTEMVCSARARCCRRRDHDGGNGRSHRRRNGIRSSRSSS